MDVKAVVERAEDQDRILLSQATELLSGQADLIANAANLVALLYHGLRDVNWAGIYFSKGEQLIVGPFQGKPACVTIPMGKGVCGTAAITRQIQRVADVHAFDGHIACDTESRSEIVLPLIVDGELLGVLDIDSPLPDRFGQADEDLLVEVSEIFLRSIQ